MFFLNNYFYGATIVLQGICALHCIRRGTQNKWIWIIILLPLIGSIAYIFTEMFNRHEIRSVQTGVTALFNPTGTLKKMEEDLRFSDTFNNRVVLADAYLRIGQIEKAIELYERSLAGNFAENEYVLTQLLHAKAEVKKYDEVVALGQKLYRLPQFPRSRGHVKYAIALGKIGQPENAEAEFKQMRARFSNFEARYSYGVFLREEGLRAEAGGIFKEIIEEYPQLSAIERRYNREWFQRAREESRRRDA
jgi:hypothetical protein